MSTHDVGMSSQYVDMSTHDVNMSSQYVDMSSQYVDTLCQYVITICQYVITIVSVCQSPPGIVVCTRPARRWRYHLDVSRLRFWVVPLCQTVECCRSTLIVTNWYDTIVTTVDRWTSVRPRHYN